MTYRLIYDLAAAAVHDSLPPPMDEELTLALAAACEDPVAATEPYGVDDGVIRQIVLPHILAMVLIGHGTKTIRVLQVSYLG